MPGYENVDYDDLKRGIEMEGQYSVSKKCPNCECVDVYMVTKGIRIKNAHIKCKNCGVIMDKEITK